MTVYILWFDDQNTNKYIVGIFRTREGARSARMDYGIYDRECMSVQEEDVLE